jgi:hypothetical protein
MAKNGLYNNEMQIDNTPENCGDYDIDLGDGHAYNEFQLNSGSIPIFRYSAVFVIIYVCGSFEGV